MVFKGNVLTEKIVIDKLTKGEWTLKGIGKVEILSWLFNDHYYNVYLRDVKTDSTTFYAFDSKLLLHRIERKGKIDRVIETGVITDILEINKDIADYQEQAVFEDDMGMLNYE